ncbi:MAG: ATP-dependent DNA ligase, partial [Mesorhizobium sp.]
VSLVWPQSPADIANHEPTLAEVVAKLQAASRSDGPKVLARLLDSASISARFAIIKLVTGGLRIGVSARLAKQALADLGKVDIAEIEELWHGLTPPYAELFAWLEGKAEKPRKTAMALFRPVMLSNPIGDVSGAFPDLAEAMDFSATLDGELLVGDPLQATGTFSDLQQRLNRKSVTPKIQQQYPAFMRCYDVLQIGDEDLRARSFRERRRR